MVRRAFKKLRFLYRQRPWIYPNGVIYSAKNWIDIANVKRGWYGGQRNSAYKVLHQRAVRTNDLSSVQVRHRRFASGLEMRTVPEAAVFLLCGVYVYSDRGVVFTDKNYIFDEFTHCFNQGSIQKSDNYRSFRTLCWVEEKLEGTVALLASPECSNYYHWIFDVLPRLHLLKSLVSSVDTYILPVLSRGFQAESLERMGIDISTQLFEIREGQKVFCDRLYVPSLPGSEGCTPDWAVQFIRDTFVTKKTGSRKIYISRSDASERYVVNEEEIVSSLSRMGFEIVSLGGVSFCEQVDMFADASVIVGGHGAGMSNIVFSGKCKVVELFSPDYVRFDCFMTLSNIIGHEYRYVIGEHADKWGNAVFDVENVISAVKK